MKSCGGENEKVDKEKRREDILQHNITHLIIHDIVCTLYNLIHPRVTPIKTKHKTCWKKIGRREECVSVEVVLKLGTGKIRKKKKRRRRRVLVH